MPERADEYLGEDDEESSWNLCSNSGLEDHPDREPQRPYVYFWADYEDVHHHFFTIANMNGWIIADYQSKTDQLSSKVGTTMG